MIESLLFILKFVRVNVFSSCSISIHPQPANIDPVQKSNFFFWFVQKIFWQPEDAPYEIMLE